ncbi:MAG: hypothetical protein AUK53_05650 [Betaproteobacteria bacterium CG2_30_59_46]|nr:MAG: hypothetical protein AUK53_05650 [Betaproteobacteria bacterium CG2_30_59_46]PIQ13714.1 MAG: hypothetical protein COW70_03140 [Hydrogenophilales bacterium CG18_big_fil_WC_8_21_14_2_50_58_12]PIY01470.1 MAG: hypothetical protein COZ23_03025 [Hydrogenophilales bacterium CG_4_10_14_3_um_filter_58_23]PJB03800.1 MAG: hypothetical protein CO125_12690 [Hydrogenophilales bacterium CG_4_9_14_3_um_filter_59_35]
MTTNISETQAEYDETRIVERPDGFYWQDKEADKVFGPFPTLMDAVQDMEYNADSDYEPGESLAEAEAEIGIADWNDPDTGLPAEETHHIEDH